MFAQEPVDGPWVMLDIKFTISYPKSHNILCSASQVDKNFLSVIFQLKTSSFSYVILHRFLNIAKLPREVKGS